MTAVASQRRRLALALLCGSQFMVVLDASIITVALPSIGTELRISQDDLSWVFNAYILTFGGFLLLGGRAADLLGRRRVFIFGLALFTVASLAAGFSDSASTLIPARAAQGLGAAIVSPSALSIVTQIFPAGSERNRALAVWGAVAGSGGTAGALLGGILTEGAGWEWVFWVNVPLGITGAALAPLLLAESRRDALGRRFDVAGAVTVTAGLALLAYALVDANAAGWGSAATLLRLLLALALLAAFVAIELRAREPLVPFGFFRARTRTGANLVGLLTGGSLFPMFFFITLYMQQILGFSALEAGLAFLPLGVTVVLTASQVSRAVGRVGLMPVIAAGLGLIAISLAWFSRISVDGSLAGDLLGPSMLAGVGMGISFVATTIAAVDGVTERDAGLASGLINTAQQLGNALGLAVLVAVAAASSGVLSRVDAPAQAQQLVDGYESALLTGAGIATLGLAAALVLIPVRRG